MKELLQDELPSYIRVSRSPSEDVYKEGETFDLNEARVLAQGTDAVIIACGEMVAQAVEAARRLEKEGYHTGVIDMYCVKPLDEEAVIRAAQDARLVVTVEEHSPYGGLGSMVAQTVAASCPRKVVNIALPDGHIIAGTNREIFAHYGLDAEGIANTVRRELG